MAIFELLALFFQFLVGYLGAILLVGIPAEIIATAIKAEVKVASCGRRYR